MRDAASGERARLDELARYAILDTPPEPALDAVCALAARLFDVPTAVISFIDAERQWFKARHGFALTETPRSVAFCARTIETPELLVVADASVDRRFAENPHVVGPPHVRFYAGAPLETSAGLRIGTVAIFDVRARGFDEDQRRWLRSLGDLVTDRLQERRRNLGTPGGAAPAVGQRLDGVVEQLPAIFWTTDRNLRYTSLRGAGLAKVGLEPDALVGRPVGSPFRGLPGRSDAAHRVALAGDGVTLDLTWNGRSYHVHIEPLRDADGAVVGTIGLALDISEQRAAEEKLRRSLEELRLSEERSRLIARATNDVVWDWDVTTDKVEWNDGITTVFGYPRGEVVLNLDWWRDRVAAADRERIWATVQTALAGDAASVQLEYRFLRGDGGFADVLDRGFILRDPAGKPVRVVGVMFDVTARNRLQARLRQADRLAAVGTLAGGVSHEINNPLSYIIANVAYAMGVLDRVGGAGVGAEELGEAKQALADASRGAERVRKIVQDLKIFARGNDDRPEALDLAKVLATALEITKNTVRHAASVQLKLEAVPPVFANEAQLAQVFVNLLVNAAEAIGVGHAHRHRIEVHAHAGANGGAIVDITDDGAGIAAEVLPHVFDPFFTTKPIGGGSGLGLAIAHGIVEALGGRIDIASTVGKGTRVRVTLPPAPRTEVAATREPSRDAAPDRRRRILIIDDEPQVLAALRRLLAREHDVETEAEGAAAVRRLEKGEAFDVILCDVMMPRMGGVELLEAVRRIRPELAPRVVFMTGGAFTDEVRAFLRASTNPFLDKPIDPERLRALVRNVAARR